jgi:hypothetical protein
VELFEERKMIIDFQQGDQNEDSIPFDDAAVETGRNFVSSMKDSQFGLGRMAAHLEPKYGDNTLERDAKILPHHLSGMEK